MWKQHFPRVRNWLRTLKDQHIDLVIAVVVSLVVAIIIFAALVSALQLNVGTPSTPTADSSIAQMVAGALGGFILGLARLILSFTYLRNHEVERPRWRQFFVAGTIALVVLTFLGALIASVLTGLSAAMTTSIAVLLSLTSLASAAPNDRANRDIGDTEVEIEKALARLNGLQKEALDAQFLASVHRDQAQAVANVLKAEYRKADKQARRSNMLYFVVGVLASIAVTLFVQPIG